MNADTDHRRVTVELPDSESWGQFVLDLLHAAEVEKQERPHTEPAGFAAAWVALHAVNRFLLQQPTLRQHAQIFAPLANLENALIDIRRGKAPPMLKPMPPAHRPPNLTDFEQTKGLAARAMSELMTGGVPRWDAARTVAKAIGSLRGAGKVTAKTVDGWRHTLEGGAGPGAPQDGPALHAYRKELPKSFGDTPRQRGDGLVEMLRGTVPA